METLWAFLSDPNHQKTLSWLGGGLVVACGGLWALIKFWRQKRDTKSGPSISADRGGIAAGRDVTIGNRSLNSSAPKDQG